MTVDATRDLNMKRPSGNEPMDFERARELIRPYVAKTQCPRSALLSREVGADVYLKLENRQHTGSFKLRGVTHKILSLDKDQRARSLIAASTGNHGAAFAYMVKKLGLNGKLFVPETITKVKLKAIEETGIPFECVGKDCLETEQHAIRAARSGQLIGPYNDRQVILGQGTVAVEMMEQLEQVDAVFVPVGGGGLISGIAAYIKSIAPRVRVIGCQPIHSAVMYHSLQAGEILTMESLPTLSDATAGGIEPGSMTFRYCQDHVDDFVLLSEEEIMAAIEWLWFKERMVVEGGAALGVAALRKSRARYKGCRVALIISGGRLDPQIVQNLKARHD